MRLFKNIKRKVGNAILPVVGTILGLTILAGSVVGVALNSSKIVYRENKLSQQNDAREILYIAAKYFCDGKNAKKSDGDLVKELQEIFGLGLKVTKDEEGIYYVWYPNKFKNGDKEYSETTDASGKITDTNVDEWLKARITLTSDDADDGSGNKEAELNDQLFRQDAKLEEKYAIGNLMTVYLTDEGLLPGRKWKLNEISLVKSDIDTFDEAYTYMNNSGTLLVDEIGMALYAYKNMTINNGTAYVPVYKDDPSKYELVYETEYLGGNYYWQNSSGKDTTTWIYKQEYDSEMLAGMLNFYYNREHPYATTEITDKGSVYYYYEEATGKHYIKASSTETSENKCKVYNNTMEFAEDLSFYVFWKNMARLCLKLDDFVTALENKIDPRHQEARFEYIWTDKGLTINAFHKSGNYWPYYYTISEIEQLLLELLGYKYNYTYQFVQPVLKNSTYDPEMSESYNFNNSLTKTIDGKSYDFDDYVVTRSNEYKGDTYTDEDGITYYLFYVKGQENVNSQSNTGQFFDTDKGKYFVDENGDLWMRNIEKSGTNGYSGGWTKQKFYESGSTLISDTLFGTERYVNNTYNYQETRSVTIDGKRIDTVYHCFDYEDDENDLIYAFYESGTTPSSSKTVNGITYNLKSSQKYARAIKAKSGKVKKYGYNYNYIYDNNGNFKDFSFSGNGYNAYYQTYNGSYYYGTNKQGDSFYYYDDEYGYERYYKYSTTNSEYNSISNNYSCEYEDWVLGAYYCYQAARSTYTYYFLPQFYYNKIDNTGDGAFYYGYARYKTAESTEIDYNKMYNRLISLKENELTIKYGGGREFADIDMNSLRDNVAHKFDYQNGAPDPSDKFYTLYNELYKYVYDTLYSTYLPAGGGGLAFPGLGEGESISSFDEVYNIRLIPNSRMEIAFRIKYTKIKADGQLEPNQTQDSTEKGVSDLPVFNLTADEFKSAFKNGVLKAYEINAEISEELLTTIKNISKEEVMQDLVIPIRYQYLPTTKYYEIFGDNGGTLGFKEEQFYNKLLSYYFKNSKDAEKINQRVGTSSYTYKIVSASYGNATTNYPNKLVLDIVVDLYNASNQQINNGRMTISFVVSPVTWNLLNTNNSLNQIVTESGEYVNNNYELNGTYKPVAIENLDGDILSRADLTNKNIPAILTTIPYKERSTSSSTTPNYVKINEKININGTQYDAVSVEDFKAMMNTTSKTINITQNTLVKGNVEWLAPNSSTTTDPYKNIKIVVANGVSLYINGSLNLRDNQDVQLGTNSLLFVNGSMFITYEYMGYLDKYDGNKTANQIGTFGAQTTSDYTFYSNVGVDIAAGDNAKIIINGNLDYKGYKARYTRSRYIMEDALGPDWYSYSRISADLILYEQSVFNTNETNKCNQDDTTKHWTHFTQECRSLLQGTYIVNGDVKFRAWDEKNTTNDITNKTQQTVAMYRNCYSNPLVNATFYVDGAFDMRGLFVSGMYDLCRANFVFAKSIIQPHISLNTIYSRNSSSAGLTNNPTTDSAYAGWQNTHGYLFIICEDAVDFSVANFGCMNIFTPYAEMLNAIANNSGSDNNFTKFISASEFKGNYPDKNVVNTWGLPSLLKKGFEDMYSPNDIGAITTDDTFDSAHNIKAT